jgi:hypothetical protein
MDSALTRPYLKHQKTIRTNQPWASETCAADNNWVKIGEENYFVNTADGRLMPSKKGQQPPDLFYFNLPQKIAALSHAMPGAHAAALGASISRSTYLTALPSCLERQFSRRFAATM